MKFIEAHTTAQTVCSKAAENVFNSNLRWIIAYMLASSDSSDMAQDELEILYALQETAPLEDYTFLESEGYVLDIPRRYVRTHNLDMFSYVADGILA